MRKPIRYTKGVRARKKLCCYGGLRIGKRLQDRLQTVFCTMCQNLRQLFNAPCFGG